MNVLSSVNPVTRLVAIMLFTLPLLTTIDYVSAVAAIALTVAVAPLAGVGPRRLVKRGWLILAATPVAFLSMALYARPGGETFFDLGLIHVTDNSLVLATAIALRVLAVGLPVVLLSADVDPTDLGDALAQVAHLPERFVIGAIAAVRLVTLFRDDIASMRLSRRARGIADQGRLRYFATLAFGLLVVSLRRGAKLATAMEARGFGRFSHRTWARESRLLRRDWIVMAAALAAGVACVGVAMALGTFTLFGVR